MKSDAQRLKPDYARIRKVARRITIGHKLYMSAKEHKKLWRQQIGEIPYIV